MKNLKHKTRWQEFLMGQKKAMIVLMEVLIQKEYNRWLLKAEIVKEISKI